MSVYKVHYWLKNPNGEVVDTSEGGEPMAIEMGASTTILGLQKAVEGRVAGDRIDVTIPPELAYGEHKEEFVTRVERSLFDVAELQPGMKFQTNTGDQRQVVQIKEVGSDFVVVDANHPLAGLTLNFELEIVSVEA